MIGLRIKNIVGILILFQGLIAFGQNCPILSYPVNGSTNIPVDITITWPAVSGNEGYLISLGTTSGGTDLLNNRSAGPINYFTPEIGLPENTKIYVTISLFLPDQGFKICMEECFTTEDVTTPPPCTTLNPNNSIINGSIHWLYSSTATGYRVTIGTTSGGSDIAANVDVGNVLSFRPTTPLPNDQSIYIQIKPYNENGDSAPCTIESLLLSEPTVDCEQFRPMLNFPDQVGICLDNIPSIFSTETTAGGYRWYQVNGDGSEELLAESRDVTLSDAGNYRLEAYNLINLGGTSYECGNSKDFVAVFSEAPIIEAVDLTRETSGLRIEVKVRGNGTYEYALDLSNGNYQDSPTFTNVLPGEHTVFVRDKDGCGTDERVVEKSLTRRDFPAFFTPNGDGFNDFWQFVPPTENDELTVEVIRIYNRFGGLLFQLDPKSKGWDGRFNGSPLPSSDYWFRATTFSGQRIKGNFTLKR